MYNFEKLQAWQQSLELIDLVYQLTKKLPSTERFALIDQLRRAVTSIALNIAEGNGANTQKDFIRYCYQALKSLYETIAALKIAERLYGLEMTNELRKCDKVSKLLHGLIKYLKTNN